jgi:hypothetical protein
MENEVQIVVDISEIVAALRRYAQQNHKSMLEVVAEHLLDDLPFSISNVIKEKMEELKPKVESGEVEYWATFHSGRSDISERMEEIIYGPDEEDES